MAERMNDVSPVIVAPRVGAQTCGNCKHQGSVPEFGPTKLCMEGPAVVHVVPHISRLFGPEDQISINGRMGAFPRGGMEVLTYKSEVRYSPAPDHWTCGRWRPRFLDNAGGVLR